jgi:hypothetical protein
MTLSDDAQQILIDAANDALASDELSFDDACIIDTAAEYVDDAD